MRFASALELEPLAGGEQQQRFEGTVAQGWDILGNTNGGYVMALLGKAALLHSGRRDVISISANFLSPTSAGAMTVESNLVKAGRRFATHRTDLQRDGRNLVVATLTTGDLDDGEGPSLVRTGPPEMPSPEECERVEPTDTFPPPFMGQIDLRLHPDDHFGVKGEPRIRAWFRLRDDEPMGSLAAVMAPDSLPPTVFRTDLAMGWSPTIQMTVHVRRRPATKWLLVDTVTQIVDNGMFEVDGNVFGEDGQIVAQSRQLALTARG